MVSQVLKVMSRTDSISPAIKLNGSQNCSRLLRHNVVKNYLYEYPNIFIYTVLYQHRIWRNIIAVSNISIILNWNQYLIWKKKNIHLCNIFGHWIIHSRLFTTLRKQIHHIQLPPSSTASIYLVADDVRLLAKLTLLSPS